MYRLQDDCILFMPFFSVLLCVLLCIFKQTNCDVNTEMNESEWNFEHWKWASWKNCMWLRRIKNQECVWNIQERTSVLQSRLCATIHSTFPQAGDPVCQLHTSVGHSKAHFGTQCNHTVLVLLTNKGGNKQRRDKIGTNMLHACMCARTKATWPGAAATWLSGFIAQPRYNWLPFIRDLAQPSRQREQSDTAGLWGKTM